MKKRVVWALLLIAVLVVVLILNTGSTVEVMLFPDLAVKAIKALAFLFFIAAGVVIGVLLK